MIYTDGNHAHIIAFGHGNLWKLVEICRRSEKIAGLVRSRLLASSKVAIAAHSRLRSMPESSTCKNGGIS